MGMKNPDSTKVDISLRHKEYKIGACKLQPSDYICWWALFVSSQMLSAYIN